MGIKLANGVKWCFLECSKSIFEKSTLLDRNGDKILAEFVKIIALLSNLCSAHTKVK